MHKNTDDVAIYKDRIRDTLGHVESELDGFIELLAQHYCNRETDANSHRTKSTDKTNNTVAKLKQIK